MPDHLSGRHRDTLAKIFAHPSSRNVEWREARSLLEAVGSVHEAHNGKLEVTLTIADLKRSLESYLSEHAKNGGFPKPLPEIKLHDLAVVAFVQDDADQTVLHAVSVPVQ